MLGLKALREQAGLSMDELAKAVGVSRQSLSAWEGGKAWPNSMYLQPLARALGCTVEELFHAPPEDNQNFNREAAK